MRNHPRKIYRSMNQYIDTQVPWGYNGMAARPCLHTRPASVYFYKAHARVYNLLCMYAHTRVCVYLCMGQYASTSGLVEKCVLLNLVKFGAVVIKFPAQRFAFTVRSLKVLHQFGMWQFSATLFLYALLTPIFVKYLVSDDWVLIQRQISRISICLQYIHSIRIIHCPYKALGERTHVA